MPFFKPIRDQAKVNALLINLERARDTFAADEDLGRTHVRQTFTALAQIKKDQAQRALTEAGWKYVTELTREVAMIAIMNGGIDLEGDLDFIWHQADKWRQEYGGK